MAQRTGWTTREDVGVSALARTVSAVLMVLGTLTVTRMAEAARTDVVLLDNGNWITGEVISLERGKLSFKTDNIGTISVEWIHVAELKSTNTFTVETEEGELYFGELAETEKNQLKVVDGDVTVATLDIDAVVNIYRVKDTFWSRLDGSLDVGYGYTQQNGATQFNLNGTVYERLEHRRISFDFSSLFSTQNNADQTTRNDFTASFYRRFTDKWFYLGLASASQNNGLDLDLRTIVAGGAGRQLYQSNKAIFSVLGGVDYNRELYTFNDDPMNSLEALGGVEFSYFTYDGLTSQVTTQFMVVPNLTDTGRVRMQLDVNFRQNIVGNLYWSTNLYESYDSDPPQPDAPKNDFGITTSLGWTF